MAQMIPLFLAEDEEYTSSMALQRVFRDLYIPLNCYDDLELVWNILDNLWSGINVSQSSASSYIRDVSLGLQAICCHFICIPVGLERVEVKNKFYGIAHFPGVVGLVDGTHIRIKAL